MWSVLYAEQMSKLTNNVRTPSCAGCTRCYSAQQVWVVRACYNPNAERTDDIEQDNTPNGRLEGFWKDTPGILYFSADQGYVVWTDNAVF